jgi:E3 ubiquitin-protein ligase NEDD4
MRLVADAKGDVRVRRGWVFGDSFAAIMRFRLEDLRKRLMVKFEGEDALDYGGVSREWFFLLSHEMFNPSHGLFEYSAQEPVNIYMRRAAGHSETVQAVAIDADINRIQWMRQT